MSSFELREVYAGYGSAKVLFDVSLVLPDSSVVALLGPNGAGKSTTLRVASGLLRPTKGSVLLDGEDVTGQSTKDLSRRGLCLIPEGRGIFPNLSVRENLLLHTYARPKLAGRQVEDVVYDRFPMLAQRRSQIAGTLSGGQQQMLALSRALSTSPSILLLDEISMGLAPLVVEELFGVIRQLANEGVSVLIVEQLAQFALAIANHAVVLSQGVVQASGPPDEIGKALAASYLGGDPAAPGET